VRETVRDVPGMPFEYTQRRLYMGILQGLASDDSATLYAAWKGKPGDDRIFYSAFDGTSWKTPGVISGNSSAGPSLAFMGGKLYAAWKGIYGDHRLFSAEFNGTKWVNHKTIGGNSDVGPTLASVNGTLYAAWKGEADLRLFYAEFDGTTWQPQIQMTHVSNSANFTSCIGPSLATLNGTLFAAWRGAIFDQKIYYASLSGTSWSVPNALDTASESSIGPSIAQFQNELYMVWKGKGTDQRLFFGHFDAQMQWQGAQQITGFSCSSSIGAAISTFGGKLFAIWKGAESVDQISSASFDGMSWTAQPSVPGNTGQDMAPMPVEGLGGSSNYILSADCQPITQLNIHIAITEDISSDNGFSFQLNCYTTKDQLGAWQQYILCYVPSLGQFGCQIDNWTKTSELINSSILFFCPFEGPVVPAGTDLEISLVFDPTNHKVTAANFSVTLPNVSPKTHSLVIDQLETDSGSYATQSDMSPIVAFQLDFVANDSAVTHLASGKGKITYTASPALTAVADFPSCIEYDEPTGETANSVYGQLPLGSSTTFTQSFAAAAT
jgi:hypothetical protein